MGRDQSKARPAGLAGTRVQADAPVRPARPAYRIVITDQGEEDLATIVSEIVRAEIGRAINGLARGPVIGKRMRYVAGLDMVRAGRAHYLIIYKTVAATRTITVIAILPGRSDPARLMKPFVVRPERERKPRSKAAAHREALLAAEDRAYLKKQRDEERKFSDLLDEATED